MKFSCGYFNVHLLQKTSDYPMYPRFIPITAGIVNGNISSDIIRQRPIRDAIKRLPKIDNADPLA